MSAESHNLRVDKCIISRLWYTTWVILRKNASNSPLDNYTRDEILRQECLIRSVLLSQERWQDRWIAWKLLREFTSEGAVGSEQELASIRFISALRSMDENIPPDVEKELVDLFVAVRHSKSAKQRVESLSGESLSFLEANLSGNPAATCRTINDLLCVWSPHFVESDSVLQNLYFRVLRKLLDNFDSETKLSTLSCVLSRLDLAETEEKALLDWLYPALSEACENRGTELALYSRKNSAYLIKWYEFLDEKFARRESADTLDNASRMSDAVFHFSNDEVSPDSNELTTRVMRRGEHWLSDILDACYTLSANDRCDRVARILSSPLLNALWPALLFEYIDKCPFIPIAPSEKVACGTLKFLLSKCGFLTSEDATLKRLGAMLENQFDVIEWILERKPADVDRSPSLKQIISSLQDHGVLSVVNMAIDIHGAEYEEVAALLKDSPQSASNFQAYRAMLSAIRAISCCENYDVLYEEAARHHSRMVALLESLFPLTLRLETMENIFSLLFLRHENFSDTDGNSESGGEEKEEEEEEIPDTVKPVKNESKPMEFRNTGFVCNEYAVGETLQRLKDAVLAAGIECAKLKRESPHQVEPDEILKRITALSKVLADAVWRLELLTSAEFVRNVGIPRAKPGREAVTAERCEILSNEEYYVSTRPKNKSIFYKDNQSSSDEGDSRSEVDVSSESGSLGTGSSSNGKRRRRFNDVATSVQVSPLTRFNRRPFVVNFMLASKECLVVQCLWKGDYEKAREAIEMFTMNNSRLDGEVRFSKALHSFKEDIGRRSNSPDATDSVREDRARPSASEVFQNIRQTVQEGVQTSRLVGQSETFLASQKATATLLDSKETTGSDILIMAILDLALTVGKSHRSSVNLRDVAIEHLKSSENLRNTEQFAYFSRIYQLTYESKLERSLTSVLRDARIPLSAKAWKDGSNFWTEIALQLRAYRRSQAIEEKPDDRGVERKLSSVGEKSFKEIIALCGDGERYLRKVHAHLKLLWKILPNNSEDTVGMTATRMLKVPLHSYFGRQIFDAEVEPDKLEAIANKLQVNLVHSVLVNCCPKLLFDDGFADARTGDKRGCVILNKDAEESKHSDCDRRDPNECVSEILSELVEIVARSIPTQAAARRDDLESLSKRPDVRRVLLKTRLLESLDLGELSVGNETLTFFLNAWNLLFLHSLLTIWTKDPPESPLRHAVSLMTIGYEIGDLGLVTLASLRSKLLGNSSWGSEFFPPTEELNEPAWQDLDLPQDPRVIFAMADEFRDSPVIRIYNARTIDEDLSEARKDYTVRYASSETSDSSKGNDERPVLRLPDLFQRYEKLLAQYSPSMNECKLTSSAETANPSNGEPTIAYQAPRYSYEAKFKYSECSSFEGDDTGSRNAEDADEKTWRDRRVTPRLLQYLDDHCWLLSYLVQRIHEESPTISETSCENSKRTACLENLLNSPWSNALKVLFGGNRAIAGLRETVSTTELWPYFEAALADGRWKDCLEILNALPDGVLTRNVELRCFGDKILAHLISQPKCDVDLMQCVHRIKDVRILAQAILSNVNSWPAKVCEDALLHALHHADRDKLPAHCKLRMNETLCRITVFNRMLPYCMSENDLRNITWYDVAYCTEKTDPVHIVESLIDANKFELCHEWLEYQAFSAEIQSLVNQDLLIGLLKDDQQDFKQALKLLQALPQTQSMKMCKGVLKKLDSCHALRFIVDYLLENCQPSKTVKYRRIAIGVEILDRLDDKERSYYVHLIKEPLLMLEQLLMNGKFENLLKILKAIGGSLPQAGMSVEDFDEIVRYYAGKSLDFRVALKRDGIEGKSRDLCHSTSSGGESTDFAMPPNVPTKEEWIPNDKARECSCCRAIIFSMFNRRHHCRRCGRVVCATCSQQRMRVLGYPPSVLVRVCDDCKRQTLSQQQAAQGAPSTASSEAFDCWRLTTDRTHNRTLREEFSFEHAPNVLLCLAILNLHSDHKAYHSFLLDRCDEMKELLQPDADGKVNPEVDHALIIKMIRSLLVAAKVKCAKLGHNAGLTHCDRFLSQVDLITTLVRSDCLALIPSGKLDDYAFRKLRDLLTEKEEWTLALDVSTKSGLDRQGVWAAWGKTRLRAGCFDEARDKFAHCLEKVSRDEVLDDWTFLPSSRDPRRDVAWKSREKSRPAKDPPLLVEILQILETVADEHAARQPSRDSSAFAREVVDALNNLKAVSQGQYGTDVSTGCWKKTSVYYRESLHYLTTYASHASILKFFLKHGEFDECLGHVLANDLEAESFFSGVYLPCLKDGRIERLQEAMQSRDPSLLVWRDYLIFTCHSLERKHFLHTLYQLQIFMKDLVRASMTCIRFYASGATSYAELCSRSRFLVDAQKYLETELQLGSFDKRRRSVGSSHSGGGGGGLTMELEPSEIDRHVNTISRQMEIAKFLGNAEREGRAVGHFLGRLSDAATEGSPSAELPTLFGNQRQKTQLAVLAILCGRDVGEGFGIGFRIMQDYNLRPERIYSLAGHVLALEKKFDSIEKLIEWCRSSGAPDSNAISDRVLAHCIKLLLDQSHPDADANSKARVDALIRLISNVELKINSYIECRQLKAAYLLAVKHSAVNDVAKIYKEADRLGQNAIKTICAKWLQQTQKKS